MFTPEFQKQLMENRGELGNTLFPSEGKLIASGIKVPKICKSFWDVIACATTVQQLGSFLYEGYEHNLRKSQYVLNRKEKAEADCFINRRQGVDSVCSKKRWRRGYVYVGPNTNFGNYQCELLKY